MSGLRAIVFDVDGTLSETEELHRRAFNETFADLGLDWHWDRRLYGALLKVTGGKERLTHYVRGHEPVFDPAGPLDDFVARIHRLKTARYTALVDGGAALLRPGVERLIREARGRGIPLAIATTTSLPNVEALLRATLGPDALALFDAIGAGDSVANKKPAPDVYLAVLEALRLPASSCVAIEDSENGLRAARAAGLETVITKSRYTEHEAFDGAALVVNDLDSPCGPQPRIDVDVLQGLVSGAPRRSAARELRLAGPPSFF